MSAAANKPPVEALTSVGNGIELCHRSDGDPWSPAILLIAGWSQQLNMWPQAIVDGFVAEGFRVVRFDNRDIGRSTRLPGRPPKPAELLTGRLHSSQYTLAEMAADTAGLLAALEIEQAHVVGVSMGGMIAQSLAARFPSSVATLTSIMSTTGGRRVGRPALSTYRWILSRPPGTREAAALRTVAVMRHIGSTGFPIDAEHTRSVALEAWDRAGGDGSPGAGRQLGAIIKSGDRTRELANVSAPTLVIHGDRDRMVHPSGGAATARAIRGARLHTVAGMGHDLPAAVHGRIVEEVSAHARAH